MPALEIAIVILQIALAVIALSTAVPAPDMLGTDVIGGFDIRSDSIDYNYTTGDYSLSSRFTATNGGTDISADRAKGNSRRKGIVADGNVIIHQNRPTPTGKTALSHFAQGASTLTCDHINADGQARIYTVIGHVRFTQGEREATADRGTFNDATNAVHMEGHVTIKDQGQTLNADTVDYNTETGDGKAGGNVIVITPIATPPPNLQKPKARKHR